MKTLQDCWRNVCSEYVRAFIEKHELDTLNYEDYWINNDPGTIICLNDMYIDMENLRYDIDNDIPKDKFEEWYWTSVDRAENNLQYINYPAFCKGAPDPIPANQLEEIKKLRKKVEQARQALEESIKDYKLNKDYIF